MEALDAMLLIPTAGLRVTKRGTDYHFEDEDSVEPSFRLLAGNGSTLESWWTEAGKKPGERS